MPRAGLDRAGVVAAAAALADEVGFANLTMGSLATKLGIRTPSLYKHVAGQDDLNRRLATLATSEAADAVGRAVQGYAGRDALAAAARAFRTYVVEHPGRYAATLGLEPTGPDDPIIEASNRLMDTFRSILRSYDVPDAAAVHTLRMLRSFVHGYATIEAGGGFQWSTGVDESYEWLITFIDRGLRAS